MTPTDARADNEHPPALLDEETGVAGLRSWRAVYIFVTLIFILWVVLLDLLTRNFS